MTATLANTTDSLANAQIPNQEYLLQGSILDAHVVGRGSACIQHISYDRLVFASSTFRMTSY